MKVVVFDAESLNVLHSGQFEVGFLMKSLNRNAVEIIKVMTRKCGITLGNGQRVPVPKEKIGAVQTFVSKTGYRFPDAKMVHEFLGGTLPPGIIRRGPNFVVQQRASA